MTPDADCCAICGAPPSRSESDPHGQFGHHQFTTRQQTDTEANE